MEEGLKYDGNIEMKTK